jgi:hypothetical protein
MPVPLDEEHPRFYYYHTMFKCLEASRITWRSLPMAKKKAARQRKKLTTDTVEARRMVVVDERGRPRIVLEFAGDCAMIRIQDEQGLPRFSVNVVGETCQLGMTQSDGGASGITLSVAEHGNGISICDSAGRPAISMGLRGRRASGLGPTEPRLDLIDYERMQSWSAWHGVHPLAEPE